MKKYTKIEVDNREQYLANKKEYDKYDIVYSSQRNVGHSHYFTIYKQPAELDNYELASEIDGFFFNVYRNGDTLDCWFD